MVKSWYVYETVTKTALWRSLETKRNTKIYHFIALVEISPNATLIEVLNRPNACYGASCSGVYSFNEVYNGKPKYVYKTTYGGGQSYTCTVF